MEKINLRLPAVLFLFSFSGLLIGEGIAGFSLKRFLIMTGALLGATCAGVIVRWIRS